MNDPAEVAAHLAQIRDVIARSRAERARSGDIYLVWGIVIIVADLSTMMGDLLGFPGWIAYPALTPIGAIYAGVSASRRSRTWSSFGSRVEGRLWIMVTLAGGALTIGGLGAGLFPLEAIVPLVCAVVGVAIGTCGALFDSRAMTLSGVMFVVVSAVGAFFPGVIQHLLFIGAMLAGYIGPAVAMLRDERSRSEGRSGPARRDA
jgi:hypothetical protein